MVEAGETCTASGRHTDQHQRGSDYQPNDTAARGARAPAVSDRWRQRGSASVWPEAPTPPKSQEAQKQRQTDPARRQRQYDEPDNCDTCRDHALAPL
jgi:hypothetical protein